MAAAAAAVETVEVEDLRVFLSSDLHCDNPSNMEYVDEMPDAQDGDVMLIAGDLHDALGPLETALRRLAGKGYELVWMWGNHDVWLTEEERAAGKTSLDKIADIEALCRRVGVRTRPTRFVSEDCDRAVWVVPLQAWYETGWDDQPQMAASAAAGDDICETFASRWMDFRRCAWPAELEGAGLERGAALCEHFSARNREALPGLQLPGIGASDLVISMSHFVPLPELIPEKRYMFEGDLYKVSGSRALRRDVFDLHAQAAEGHRIHLFGHTHIPWDDVVQGVRFIQWPMGYPRERHRTFIKAGKYRPLMLFDAGKPAARQIAPRQPTKWGNYYLENERRPEDVEPAEWVRDYYEQKRVAGATPDSAAAAAGEEQGLGGMCGCMGAPA